MTYACADIIYGLDMGFEGRANPLREFEDLITDMVDENLVETAYNGNGSEPHWIGVSMCGLEEGDADIDGIRLAPTPQDEAEFAAKKARVLAFLAQHDDGDAAKLAAHVEAARPKVWLAWSSS